MELINFGECLINPDNISRIIKTEAGLDIYMSEGTPITVEDTRGTIWQYFVEKASGIPGVEKITVTVNRGGQSSSD